MIVRRIETFQPSPGQRVIVTGPDPHPIVVGVGPRDQPVDHEEADVLIAYHMLQEAKIGQTTIKVVSDDTDVLIILAHHLHTQPQTRKYVSLSMESTSSGSVVNVNGVVKTHKAILPNLLAAHALSGCDCVSSLSGIGKATVLKKLRSFKGLMKLGDLCADKDEIVNSCLSFVAILHGHDQGSDLDSMRENIFQRRLAGKRHITPKLSSLPPTMASFEAHCMRAHFQVALWRAATGPKTPDLSPLACGWAECGPTLVHLFGL